MLIPITAIPKPRMTQQDKWLKRPVVVKYWKYKKALKAFGITLPQPCRIIFYLPMPASWSKKKRAAFDGMPHKNVPDVDNLAKGLMDALYDEDDAHVWSTWIEKRWAETGAIEILPLKEENGQAIQL